MSEPKQKKMIPIPEPPIIPKKEMSKPTVEEMVERIDAIREGLNIGAMTVSELIDLLDDEILQAIREALTEKPTVSRVRARIAITAIWGFMMLNEENRALKELTELGIEVSKEVEP